MAGTSWGMPPPAPAVPPPRSPTRSGLTESMAMANPMFWVGALPVVLEATAVFMPTTSAWALTSGPPELPGLMAASVCSRPVRFSVSPLSFSADRVRFLAETIPSVTDGPPASASALPMASTRVPTLAWDESPSMTVGRPEA